MLTMKRAMSGLLMAAAMMTTTAWAHDSAAADTPDEVALQNGGLVKGNILVMDPGEKVVIQVPGEDEPRTIPWSEVSDVQRGTANQPAAKGTQTAEPDQTGAKGKVKVHIESDDADDTLVLTEHRKTGTVLTPYGTLVGIASSDVCTAPCDKSVEPSSDKMYTIAGAGVPSSEAFTLGQYEGDVTVKVDSGSTALRGGGVAALTVGLTGLVAGAVVLPLGVMMEDEPSTRRDGADMRDAGIGILAGGAAVLTAGIIMLTQSGTDVEVERGTSQQARRTPRKARWWHGEF